MGQHSPHSTICAEFWKNVQKALLCNTLELEIITLLILKQFQDVIDNVM